MSMCCEVGRSRADSRRHMVHPGEPLEIHVLGKLLSCHLAPAPPRVMGWRMRGVGIGGGVELGGWAGKLVHPVPPTFIIRSPVSACNQISAESPTETWLKAGLLAFFSLSVPLNRPFPTCPFKSFGCYNVYLCVYWLWAIKEALALPPPPLNLCATPTISIP